METKQKKQGQESAFGFSVNTDRQFREYKGISKRFYAACVVMQGLVSADSNAYEVKRNPTTVVNLCYKIVDELLKQETL